MILPASSDPLLCQWDVRLRAATQPLPGSQAYLHKRPMSVSLAYDHWPLLDFLAHRHPHWGREYWQEQILQGAFQVDGREVRDLQHPLRAGNRLLHTVGFITEPEVATHMQPVYADASLLALCKPAPLPLHPCGRFNRNTVVNILVDMFPGEDFKPVHRLDADTTGLQVLARTRRAARALTSQFEKRTVRKIYLARVLGHMHESVVSQTSIGAKARERGARAVLGSGLAAHTLIAPLLQAPDGTTLLQVAPTTGRTNQIRLHLADMGYPIVGDRVYGAGAHEGAFSQGPICLHACTLSFQHPEDGTDLQLRAPMPLWAKDLGEAYGRL